MTWTIYINFRSPFPRRLHKNLALIGQAVSEEKTFEIVDGRTTTTEDDDGSTYNLGLIGHAVSKKKMFENNVYVHVLAPGQGQTTPGVIFFSLTVLFSQYSPLLQDFLH